ncbi:MAG: amino-acid N-acetyltransferase [Treponema sp.]|jgi:amino-acid N-acetyltransferase|nr:amino-acid N-acetyltransferase [Treponema sp.]
MNHGDSRMDLVREAFHYQSRFSGSTMVFKIDFPVTLDPAFPSLMKDLALLARTGFRVVIVPGAKEWIDSVLAEYGIVSAYLQPDAVSAEPGEGAAPESRYMPKVPLRITGERAMPLVEMAAFHVATRFVTALSANRCDALVGNFLRARGLGVLAGRDMENTGRAEKILVKPMRKVLELGMVPVLPCIGWGPSGKPYNVPSGEIALAAAAALGAVKLFVVSGRVLRAGALALPPGVETGEGRIIRLTPGEAEAVLELNAGGAGSDPASGGAELLADLALALAASRAGVERVHLVDGREDGAVLRELFSNLGSGTMVYADEYEAIRPLQTADIPDVLRIMEPLMRRGILVRRGPEDIQEKKTDYHVFGVDGRVHACGALHRWGNDGEIAALAVDGPYADLGLGSRVVRFLMSKAAREGMRRVFALTTKTQDWFEALGFREGGVDALPEERRKSYNSDRNSKIYLREL